MQRKASYRQSYNIFAKPYRINQQQGIGVHHNHKVAYRRNISWQTNKKKFKALNRINHINAEWWRQDCG